MLTTTAKYNLLRNHVLHYQFRAECPTNPILVDEVLQQIASGKNITEVLAYCVTFDDGTVATTETIRDMWRPLLPDIKRIVRVFLADHLLTEGELKCIEDLHFKNPFLCRMNIFDAEFLFGRINRRWYVGDALAREQRCREVMKDLFSSRMQLDRGHYDHFWVKRVGDRLHLRNWVYGPNAVLKLLLEDNLMELVPGNNADMIIEEGPNQQKWHQMQSKLPEGHSFRALTANQTYKIRLKQTPRNYNIRNDLAALGIPRNISMGRCALDFLSAVPPQWLLRLAYDEKLHTFTLGRIYIHNFRKEVIEKEPSIVEYHSQWGPPPKRRKLVRLPDRLPVTNSPIIAVDESFLRELFPTTQAVRKPPSTYGDHTPRTVPTWTGRVRKTRTWEMEAEIATGEKAYIAYGKWRKNTVGANSARSQLWSPMGGQQNGYVAREHATAGVTPFDF